jgi:ribosomal-protein-alanine N-acetyltransferase
MRDTRSYLNYAVAAWDSGVDYTYGLRLREGGRLIGSIGILNESGKIQFGYILSPTQWNQGFATEACKAVVDLLKNQPGVHRIWTLVDVENTASIRVLVKAGLKEEARLEKWFRFVNQNNQPKDCVIFHVPLP